MEQNQHILLKKLDEFIRKFYKNQLIKGVIYTFTIVFLFFLSLIVLEYFGTIPILKPKPLPFEQIETHIFKRIFDVIFSLLICTLLLSWLLPILWLFIRIIRLLIPLVLLAIVIGWVWDVFDSKGGGNKYDNY